MLMELGNLNRSFDITATLNPAIGIENYFT